MSSLSMMEGFDSMPEFVTLQMVADSMNRTTAFLNSINIAAGLPSMTRGIASARMYRWTEIKKRLIRNRIMPPDDNHPLKEYSVAEAASILGVNIRRLYKWKASGRLEIHMRDHGRVRAFIYRKDIEWIRRNYDRRYILSHMERPLRISDTLVVIGLGRRELRNRKDILKPLPRTKPREPRKYDKATLMSYAEQSPDFKHRRSPMPDLMTREVARIYMGISDSCMSRLCEDDAIRPHKVLLPSGKYWYRYIKSELDAYMLDKATREAYGEPDAIYYTRTEIEHKFSKTKRWIEEYICNDCRRVDRHGNILPSKKDKKTSYVSMGWYRPDVEAAVANCGDEHVNMYMRIAEREAEKERKRVAAELKKCRTLRDLENAKIAAAARKEKKRAADAARKEREAQKAAERRLAAMNAPKPPAVLYHTPIDQIEAAIDAGFAERAEEYRKKKTDAKNRMHEQERRRNAIRNTLNLETDMGEGNVSVWDRLAYSTHREIFTILFNRNGNMSYDGSMRYRAYPHEGDEYIITVSERKAVKRRDSFDTSIPKLIASGIEKISSRNLAYLPEWIIIASSTSYIPDPRFLDSLRAVPKEYGAVAPYGYEYIMPDGSFDGCARTVGMYSMYHADRPGAEFCIGTTVGEIKEVAVMDGPFVAIRGEYMNIMGDMLFFHKMGECRSMIGPMISCIFRKVGGHMAAIPVNSVSCAEYAIKPGTEHYEKIVRRMQEYADTK